MKVNNSYIATDFSLEVTGKEAENLHYAKEKLPNNTEVKVAFLGNETLAQRLFAIESLSALGMNPMPIISARRLISIAYLDSYLTQAIKAGRVSKVFLVGGDPTKPRGPFKDSMDVINANILDKFSTKIDTVGIAGYPEGHPRVRDEVLWEYLKMKHHSLQAKGFSVEITTQLSFNVEAVVSWIEQVRGEGIAAPIRVGIPSPSTLTGLIKFARQCQVSTSVGLLRQYGWKATSLLSTVDAYSFLTTLNNSLKYKQLGDIRLHIYPMGNLDMATQWAETHL